MYLIQFRSSLSELSLAVILGMPWLTLETILSNYGACI